jgi:hypothetical protein
MQIYFKFLLSGVSHAARENTSSTLDFIHLMTEQRQ